MKYYIYCRRSQDREDQQMLSIESQKRELILLAEKYNLEIVDVPICEDMSAYNRGRPKFNKMIADIEAGKADGILTWHLTRLARNSADGGLIISLMDEGKIKELRTVEKTYSNTTDDKFMMNIHFAMAKKSSDDTSAFVKNNLKTKLEKGEYPGRVPYPYLNIGNNGVISGREFDGKKQAMLESLGRPLKRIELDPIEGHLMRKLFDLALTGGYNVTMLQEEAIKLGIVGKFSGKKLAKQTMLQWFTDIFYTGSFLHKGHIYIGVHEPLLTEKEFKELQNILFGMGRRKLTRQPYTFSSLIECIECGHRMSGEHQKGISYYRCPKAKGAEATCSNTKYLRQDALEKQVEEFLEQIQIPDRILSWALKSLKISFKAENSTLQSRHDLLLQKQREEVAKQERLTSKWLSEANAGGKLISDEDYMVQKESIKKSISNFEEQLKDIGSHRNSWLEKCEDFFKKVRTLKEEFSGDENAIAKRIVLQSLGAQFIRKDEKLALVVEEPFSFLFKKAPLIIPSEPNKNSTQSNESGILPNELSVWLGEKDSNLYKQLQRLLSYH